MKQKVALFACICRFSENACYMWQNVFQNATTAGIVFAICASFGAWSVEYLPCMVGILCKIAGIFQKLAICSKQMNILAWYLLYY